MEPVVYALILTSLAGLSTGIGALLGVINRKPSQRSISFIMAFSAGVMIFLSFMEMLGEAEEALGMAPTLLWLTVGIIIVFLIDMLLPEHENVHDHLLDTDLMKKGDEAKKSQLEVTPMIGGSSGKIGTKHYGQINPRIGRGRMPGMGRGRGRGRMPGMGPGMGRGRSGMGRGRRHKKSLPNDDCEFMFCVDNPKMLKLGILSMLGLFIHNLPEGLATFSASLIDPTLGLEIALAIMLHNIPEGICIAVPIYLATKNKKKAFMYAFISGLAEPIGALLAWAFLYRIITTEILMSLLASVAGIMIYISVDTLIPTAKSMGYKHTMVMGFSAGMILMGISLIFL